MQKSSQVMSFAFVYFSKLKDENISGSSLQINSIKRHPHCIITLLTYHPHLSFHYTEPFQWRTTAWPRLTKLPSFLPVILVTNIEDAVWFSCKTNDPAATVALYYHQQRNAGSSSQVSHTLIQPILRKLS